jgi:NTE family protein
MKRRALVLGGGGVIGVAWESGLIAGLAEAGLEVADADLIVGTSAGSIVGSRVAAGQDLSRPRAHVNASLPMPEEGPDLESLRNIFGRWSSAGEVTRELCAELGALALAARTASEEAWISQTCGNLGFEDWPDDRLRIVTVDAGSGERVVHHAGSDAPLRSAIAASCAVPGMFPPIRIGDRHYFDGGVHSGTNADVALEIAPGVVLVVAPICAATAPFGALAERCLEAESRAIESKGGTLLPVLPGDADLAAFGPHLMDVARAPAALEAGRLRGRELVAELADLWG